LRWQQVPGQFDRDAKNTVNSRVERPKAEGTMMHFNTGLLSLLVLLLPTVSPLAAESSKRDRATFVEPLTLLQDRQIAGCGFRASVPLDGQTVSASVTAFRDGLETVFVVAANWPDASGAPLALDTFRLVTSSHDTAKDFPKPAVVASGNFETRARLEGFSGASFIQGIMVGGGTFELRDTNDRTATIALPAPMPQNVRGAYLNCAGDLFRPED
jgi:hypothetical protein